MEKQEHNKAFGQCRFCKAFEHVEKVCEGKKTQRGVKTQVVEDKEKHEEKLSVAACYSTNINIGSWLIDSGCSHHMTHDQGLVEGRTEPMLPKSELAMENTWKLKPRETF